jgi:hypothetical protein
MVTLTDGKVIEASQVLSATAISLVRISLLLFYRRVFPTPKFRIADTVMLVLTICWWLQNVIVSSSSVEYGKELNEQSGHYHGHQTRPCPNQNQLSRVAFNSSNSQFAVGHCYTMSPFVRHPDSTRKSKKEDHDSWHLRTRILVS